MLTLAVAINTTVLDYKSKHPKEYIVEAVIYN